MHELWPQPGRMGRPTRHTPACRTPALTRLIIPSYAAKVKTAVIEERDVTLVMSSEKNKKKRQAENNLGPGEERGELRNK